MNTGALLTALGITNVEEISDELIRERLSTGEGREQIERAISAPDEQAFDTKFAKQMYSSGEYTGRVPSFDVRELQFVRTLDSTTHRAETRAIWNEVAKLQNAFERLNGDTRRELLAARHHGHFLEHKLRSITPIIYTIILERIAATLKPSTLSVVVDSLDLAEATTDEAQKRSVIKHREMFSVLSRVMMTNVADQNLEQTIARIVSELASAGADQTVVEALVEAIRIPSVRLGIDTLLGINQWR